MHIAKRCRIGALALSAGILAAACGSETSGNGLGGVINASGSSTVEPISTRVAELFQDNVASGVDINVNGPGTGDGFKAFCGDDDNARTDISGASRAIKDSEAANCAANGIEFIELKVAFDGIAVMVHPDNPVECVSFGDIYGLMSGEAQTSGVANWNDAEALAGELGSSTDLPDLELQITAPGTESGTYDSFIEIVLEHNADKREQEQPIRDDFAGNSDDNVIVQGISGQKGAFGWVGYAFADANRDVVKLLEVDGGDGCVEPTIETIADATYPVSRALYIYVNKARAEAKPALVAYIDYYLGDAYTDSVTRAFGDSGYVELPAAEMAEVTERWITRTTGKA